MPRASWRGFLRLSLVSCPIYLSPATARAKSIRLHQVWQPAPIDVAEDVWSDRGEGQQGSAPSAPRLLVDDAGPDGDQSPAATRVTLRPHDPATGEEIDEHQVVKGYEYTRGEFVTFTAEELKALDVESSKVIDLERFVPRDDLDPVYFDSSYYLYPDGSIAVETLRVIGAAMAEAGVIGLGRLTLSRRERMVMVETGVRGWRCSHCALQAKSGRHNSAAPRATSMPRWWQSRVRSSGSGPANSTRVPTVTVIRRRCSS
jgi:DNA end-binding protein Ku